MCFDWYFMLDVHLHIRESEWNGLNITYCSNNLHMSDGGGGCHVTLRRTLRKQQPEQGITVTGGFHVITFTRPPPEVITAVAKKSLPLPMSVTVIMLYEYNKKEFPLYCFFFPPLLFGASLFPTFFPFILDLAGNIRLLPDHFILSIKLANHWFRANFSTDPSTCTSWITITPVEPFLLSFMIFPNGKRSHVPDQRQFIHKV